MNEMDLFPLSRAIHIIGVVMWIGGVAFVTTVLIPALKKMDSEKEKLALFEQLEGRFGLQAKVSIILTGLSGFYMLHAMGAWSRYLEPQFWWLHLMTFIWIIFSLVLFVFEPRFLHQWFHQQAEKESVTTFKRLHTMHIVLLSLSLLATLSAVLGAHGFSLFY
ncbi:MAG: hypothetical protein JKY55_06190 [Aliivibrio sp.]|uniref:hypothetical protein n=1 Tax=Aliivibrio sp. TaxID=1872443 RepID=UPI001A58EF02|nr:hypothetical protein [Aliivibrio sp.]